MAFGSIPKTRRLAGMTGLFIMAYMVIFIYMSRSKEAAIHQKGEFVWRLLL